MESTPTEPDDRRGPPQWILDSIAQRHDGPCKTVRYHLGGSAPVEVRAVFHSSDSNEYWAELADGRVVAIRRGEYFDLVDRFHRLAGTKSQKS